jgi:NAD+ synthase (glutamine-hydrolysing)
LRCRKDATLQVKWGSAENLALQNIQARLRMVVAFLRAAATVRGKLGFLLVLISKRGRAASEGTTKYDRSSADINPTGSRRAICSRSCRALYISACRACGVEAAPPTAELEPLVEGTPTELEVLCAFVLSFAAPEFVSAATGRDKTLLK